MLRKVFNYLQAGDFLLYLATILMINVAIADEFNTEGPYGILYFDTAGPFTVSDLNSSLSGDVNLDETINIQDILLVINHVLGNNNLNEDELAQSDVNNDSIIDILDIISLVNFILYPVPMGWDFEEEWTGSDSYIFVQYVISGILDNLFLKFRILSNSVQKYRENALFAHFSMENGVFCENANRNHTTNFFLLILKKKNCPKFSTIFDLSRDFRAKKEPILTICN